MIVFSLFSLYVSNVTFVFWIPTGLWPIGLMAHKAWWLRNITFSNITIFIIIDIFRFNHFAFYYIFYILSVVNISSFLAFILLIYMIWIMLYESNDRYACRRNNNLDISLYMNAILNLPFCFWLLASFHKLFKAKYKFECRKYVNFSCRKRNRSGERMP